MRRQGILLRDRLLGLLASGAAIGNISCGGQATSNPGSETGGAAHSGASSTGGGSGHPSTTSGGTFTSTGGSSSGGARGNPSSGTGGNPSGGTGGAVQVTDGGFTSNAKGGGSGVGGFDPSFSGGTKSAVGGSNCYNPGIGTCCTSEQCVPRGKVREEFASYIESGAVMITNSDDGAAGAGGEAGASSGAPAACPTLTGRMSFCSWFNPGVVERDALCCYSVTSGSCCGRPFVVAGQPRLPSVMELGSLTDAGSELCDIDENLRVELAAAWLADARMEHASVAAFARFVLQLLSFGAPSALVHAAQRAMADEIRHAEICFALASRYAGTRLDAGPMPLTDALNGFDLAAVAALVVEEGCIGETIAAVIVAEQAAGAHDAELRHTLEQIAEDEARHAELSWAFVGWALDRGDQRVRDAVRAAFTVAATPNASCRGAHSRDRLRTHGQLGAASRAQLVAQIRESVVEPCVEALLGVNRSAA